MSEQWQIRRGTTAENDGFTGAEGEITMDTDKKQLRVHDGQTQGGAGVIDPIVAFQVPTAENNYTWYRKYRSGWVEQGGYQNTSDWTTINLPITMADTNYYVSATSTDGVENITTIAPKISNVVGSKTVSSFKVMQSYNSSTYYNGKLYWEVKGMAA